MRSFTTVATLSLILFVAASFAVVAAEETYGRGLTKAKVVSTLELLNEPEKYVGQTIRVRGRVHDVCPKMGCWIDIVGKGDDRVVRFKVKDGEIVFPMSTKGQRVVAEGVFTKHEMTRDEAVAWARHLAEERGEAFDEASFDGQTTLYQIKGVGAVVKSKKKR